ncbi:MAG TPA: cation-translocating P-type ATPase [Lentimicrobium sp.]|nr:cation-translocating P-type ATPase [Lentimicrobium sp.]
MWYTKAKEEVLTEFNTDPLRGLSSDELVKRREKYGPNKLQAGKKKSIVSIFIKQLRDWLIYVLLAAVLITVYLGEYIDAVIIILVIIVNAVLGVVQEVKAGKAIEALQKMSSPKALVRRDGIVSEVESETLVPGDILILDAGRYVAADIRIISSMNLKIEESALTGESVPSEKSADLLYEADTPLGDRENMAFMSNLVTYGRGEGIVTSTGMDTEVGKIANFLVDDEDVKTPLEIRLDELGKMLGKIAIGICAFIFILSAIQGRDLAQMFLTSVSLAVASIPEGLAAIVAVVLSIGVTTMSKKNAIIRRLPAVETLGSVNIVCSDKTGTLTQNKMTVVRYFTLDNDKEVKKSENNQPAGDTNLKLGDDVRLLAESFILSSDATFENGKGTGDPTEIALLVFADTLHLDRKEMLTREKRIGENSFDSERKLMSTLTEADGKFTVYTKGAIDNLIKISTHVIQNGQTVLMDDSHREKFRQATEKMSLEALRTLGAAYKPVNGEVPAEEMEKDLILIGLVGMIDPPREEVKPSIELAKKAGITIVMITGDHKNTAFAIADELNIADHIEQAVTGQEIEKFSDQEFAGRVSDYRVFARVSPEHKVKIVRALKANGNIVSMTGDGVNDAPSLNAADIGVAMGITGTDVAKGAADMILTDDNFSTIITAIEQGRNIYNNIRKAVLFLLTCNLGEVIAMFVTLLMGWQVPLLATQLLWINLLTDSLPAIALGMDKGDPDVMLEKPRNPKESFFGRGAGLHAILGGVVIGLLTIVAFWYGYYENGYSPFDKVPEEVLSNARTLAFMVLVASQMFYGLAMRSQTKSIFTLGVFGNKYLIGAIVFGIVAQLLVVGIPFMQKAFGLEMPDMKGWIAAISLGLLPLFLNELYKLIKR